ncbi:hypothetical protein ANASTE_00015 [Anaerofustis stercorihominis DSM 17244]|uniref:Uncharacterized protein n=1 Tax=Anaerofustis stercorihominis DSM 17244 TaxID=445971 RepID=B1C5M7_9FIRM|nr:hypothetical protein [Anaerofustis stercorihominis]EDS73659.1 hypothetical protein ANASTE_00015 [Anaerofustis stercorihominis DSM 17244]
MKSKKKINNDNIFGIEDILDIYKFDKTSYNCNLKIVLNKDKILYILSLLDELEKLDDNWVRDVYKWKDVIKDFSDEDIKTSVVSESELEQMSVYFVFVYFCTSVYDYEVLSKIKMAVISTLIWENICRAESFIQSSNNEIDKLSEGKKLELAWRYSRELEHSDLNLDKMEDLMNDRVDINDLLNYL